MVGPRGQRRPNVTGGRVAGMLALAALALVAARMLGGSRGQGGEPGDRAAAIVEACDPAKQTGCAGDEKCDLFCSGGHAAFACRKAEGTLAVGARCRPSVADGPETCPKGTVCLASAAGTVCVQICAAAVECSTGACTTVQALMPCPPDPKGAKPFAVRVCQ